VLLLLRLLLWWLLLLMLLLLSLLLLLCVVAVATAAVVELAGSGDLCLQNIASRSNEEIRQSQTNGSVRLLLVMILHS
jgi:hypothetical protein